MMARFVDIRERVRKRVLILTPDFPHVVFSSRIINHDTEFDDITLPWCIEMFGPPGRSHSLELPDLIYQIDLDARWVYYAGDLYFKDSHDACIAKMRWG